MGYFNGGNIDKYQEYIEKEKIEYLGHGVFVIEDFKKLTLTKALNKVDKGEKVYAIDPYGDGESLVFTGKVLFQKSDVYETSEAGGWAYVVGEVPKGTLIVAFDDD